MKQLKFMLAAATAISLATAAQAGTNYSGFPDNFDSATAGDAATTLTGYEFNGADGDDESVVQAGGYNQSANALKVNTGTEPLLRAIDYSTASAAANAVELDKSKAVEKINSLDIDTMVQFTVTPETDTVMPGLINPDLKDEEGNVVLENNIKEDKLLIYLQEKTDGEAKSNVLKVWASLYTPAQDGRVPVPASFKPQEVKISNDMLIQPNTWYRLQVSTKIDDAGVVYFEITLAGNKLTAATSLYPDSSEKFPSLLGKSSTTLKYVGFAGEGLVDDLVVSRELDAPSTVDFTLALGDGVSTVSWTVNGEQQDTAGGTFTADSGTTLTVAINSVTYAAGYAGTQDWTTYTYAKAESGSVEITAEKFADVAADGTATPTEGTVAAVTEGAFKVPEATEGNAEAVAEAKADLAKALTWASSKAGKSYTAAIAAINGMTFDEYGDPSGTGDAKTNAEAYLLDCAANQNAIDEAMEDFVLTGFSIGADGAMTFGVGEDAKGNGAAYANGKIEVRGKAALNAANWVKDCPGATFFKAFLVK